MNIKSLLTIALLILSLAGHTQKNVYVLQSDWRDSAIVIDGSPIDWDQPFRYYDSKSKIQYSIVNDASNIYLSIKTADEKAQMKIFRAGMDVVFDVSGKKKETATIHYPLKSNTKMDVNNDPSDPEQQVVEKPDVKKMKLDWSMSDKEARTTGFKDVPVDIGIPDSANKYGIQAAFNWDRSDILTYELKVPFKYFYKEKITGADTIKPITITVKINAMDLPMIPTNSAADVTGPAGGTPGMNNNSSTGGMNGGMPNSMNNNNRPQTSSPQPTMTIPKNVVDMGIPLSVPIKIRLAYR